MLLIQIQYIHVPCTNFEIRSEKSVEIYKVEICYFSLPHRLPETWSVTIPGDDRLRKSHPRWLQTKIRIITGRG